MSATPSRIRLYNPHRLTDEELIETFIARQDLFLSVLSDIVGERPRGVPQHHLVVGQRGMGKTTLLQRIAVELRTETHRGDFLPLTFPEEQYVEVDRVSKFWLNCLDSLADALEREEAHDRVSKIDEEVKRLEALRVDETTFAEECRDAFDRAWRDLGRRPVLFIDNFNLLLSRCGDKDYMLRGYFTRGGAPVLVGASLVYPQEVPVQVAESKKAPRRPEDYGSAFYDGFKPHYLGPLELTEIREVIVRIARAFGRPDVANQVYQQQARLAALRDLTGGIPRTAVLLFELFAAAFSEDTFDDLESLLDSVTPLYQSRLDQLSDQGKTIVGVLARNWAPITKRDIGEASRIPDGSISPQLGRLRDVGVVEEVPVYGTTRTGYQIAERFFNIWYLMRFTTRRQRAHFGKFANFLTGFYSSSERVQCAERLLTNEDWSSTTIQYAMALAESLPDHDAIARKLGRKAQLLLVEQNDGIRERIAEILDPSDIDEGVFEFAELKRRLAEKVPSDASMDPREFAELVVSSPSLLPCSTKTFDRQTLASSEVSSEQFAQLQETLEADRKRYSDTSSQEATDWLCTELGSAALTSWDNIDQVNALTCEACTRDRARILSDAMPAVAKKKLSDEAYHNLERLLGPTDDASAEDWTFWGADLYFNFRRAAEAEAALRKAIALEPAYAHPWYFLGSLFHDHHARYEEAEAAYRKAIELNSALSSPWNDLGNLLQDHLARYEEAEEAYRKAIELDPGFARPWYNLGNLLQYRLARHEEAEEAYRKAIELDPAYAYPWNGLGNLLQYRLARYEEAEEAYRRAIELDPTFAYPWDGVGNLLKDHLARYEEAEAAYRKAIELDPTFAYPWDGVGNLLKDHLARYEEAEAAYRKAIELDPAFAHPWYNLGNLLKNHLARYKEAEEAYRKAIELDPASAYPWNGLGNLLKDHLARYKEAEEAYRNAIELDPADAYLWNRLGNLLKDHLARYEEAEEAYRKAIELDPASAYPWCDLGDLLRDHLACYEEAEEAYRKAIELDTEYAYPWNGLGVLLRDHLARYEEAEEAYRKAGELDPKSWAWNGHGNLLLDYLNRVDQAAQAFEKAIDLDSDGDFARLNLVFLLRDHVGDFEAARRLLNTLSDKNACLDTQHLHAALFAAYEDNWGIATEELIRALREVGGELPANTRDDWYRASAVLLHLGFGVKLVELLEQEGADVEMMPWFEAVRAHVEGDRRYLRNIPAEARPVAEKIFDEIAIRRKHLPERTRRG